MSYPIDLMSERALRAEAERLKQLIEVQEATRSDAFRLAEIRAALRAIERVKEGRSPFAP